MAPNAYTDTYQAYKQGTKWFTTWLIQAAQRCGADISFLDKNTTTAQNGIAEAKKKKTSKSTKATYEVPLREFKRLASEVAASTTPRIRLPRSIATLIRSVISLRQEANNFFANLPGHTQESTARGTDDRHRYFISEDPTQLTNLFEALKVEEKVDGDDTSPIPTAPESKPSKQQDQVEYQLEATKQDQIFAMFAFFKDVNEIRDYIRSVWQDYRNGRVDVMSAAVTTDTAFTLLKHSSADFLQSQSFKDYDEMIIVVLNHFHISEAPPLAFKDWFCFDVYNLLDQYAGDLKPSNLPVYRPGQWGEYEPSRDRSTLLDNEKEQEVAIVLFQVLPEFAKLSSTKLQFPVKDLVTAGLRKMMDASSIDGLSMYAVFATQIFVDIHHVLRDNVILPLVHLRISAQRAVTLLEDYFNQFRGRSVATWAPENDMALRQISEFAKTWVREDRIAACFPNGVQGVKPPPYHLLRNHPVLAGLLTFRLNLLLNEAGITLCNAWGSVMYPIHLYNAARQTGDLKEKWDDAEYMIKVHSAKRLFVGAPPTEPSEYLKRFMLALGASASNFARNRRRGGPDLIVESKKGPRGLKDTSPVKEIFMNRYC